MHDGYCVCDQSFSHVQFFGTPWTLAHQASLSISQAVILEWTTLSSFPTQTSNPHLLHCHLWGTWEAGSVQFSHSVMSDYLQSHGLQHARPPCPSTPRVTQTHVLWVGDGIQPSYHLLSPSPPAFNLSQHQGLFKWVSSSHKVNKVLELQLQHQSFQ